MTKNLIETVLISNKDYKALLQERNELKKACEKCKLFDIEKTNRGLLERIDELEQENKELKKQIESDKGLITVGGKQQYDMTIAYDKCKTALEEIREVAKVNAITTCWSVLNFCDECKEDCEDQSPFIKLKEIVDKINEVLDE